MIILFRSDNAPRGGDGSFGDGRSKLATVHFRGSVKTGIGAEPRCTGGFGRIQPVA